MRPKPFIQHLNDCRNVVMEYFPVHTIPTDIKISNLRGISAKTWESIGRQ